MSSKKSEAIIWAILFLPELCFDILVQSIK